VFILTPRELVKDEDEEELPDPEHRKESSAKLPKSQEDELNA
jgi:hypothetical protein